MAISSKNNKNRFRWHTNSQFRYGLIYMAITTLALLLLNYYSSVISQQVFYQSKEASMVEKCLLASSEISGLEVMNYSTVTTALSEIDSLRATRIIVTDHTGLVVYDSQPLHSTQGKYALLPEIVQALSGNDAFTWRYYAETAGMYSQAATPIYTYGSLTGCVYMMDFDAQQGNLMRTLQRTVLTVSIVLELVVILFSLAFSSAFSQRMRRIMTSMRIIRGGDYSHKVDMGGHDELTVLGEEFNDLTDRLQTSESKRRQFVSDASHELKTPLASIKLLSDSILQNSMDLETVKEFVGDIGREADRLTRMSEKLLSLSRIETQEDGDCEIIYMKPTMERVVRMLGAIAREQDITIETDFTQDCPILILEDDLYQIAFNLAENGIKYNVPGGKLCISTGRMDDNAVLKISDTGVGIPEESISHIFERFYRVDKARSRKSGGSGLGLSIVRSIIERNSGKIMVESAMGHGTTFTVTFPSFDTEEVLKA